MTGSDTAETPSPPNAFEPRRHGVVTAAALVPALGAGVWFQYTRAGVYGGARVLLAIAVSYACGALVEVAFSYVRRRKARVSWSLLVTGLVLPLVLPPATPLWMVGLGTAFGVFFAEKAFGGEGHNVFHPALVGKCFLLVSWPSIVGDAIHATVPVLEEGASVSALGMLLGPGAGGMGETCAAAVVIGALALLVLRAADWRTVVATLVSASALGVILWLVNAERFVTPLETILSGSFLFGACFLATDPATSPGTGAGKWVYGCLIGLLAVLIRNTSAYGTYTEAMMFAVLLGNLFAPAIDSVVRAITSGPAGKMTENVENVKNDEGAEAARGAGE